MKTLIVIAALVAAACARVVPSEEEIQRHWTAFKAEHGKQYASEVEELHRMKVFKENVIRIAKHNARFAKGEVTFEVGVNRHTDLHTHEIVEMLNGYRAELKRPSRRVHRASNLTWPWNQKVDWRTKGYVTPVKDQGQCGSCWAFSTTGALEGQLFKKTGSLVALSEQNLVDCSGAFGNEGCNGGLQDAAFQWVIDNGGIDSEESYPYTAKDGECRYMPETSAGTEVDFVDVNPTEKDLQDAVAKIGPISVAIDASQWTFHSYKKGLYYEPACTSVADDLDHAVLVVGYGSEFPNHQYWIVKNSWNDSWGEDGYIRMARNKNNNCGIASQASYPIV